MALLLAACQSDPSLQSTRVGAGHYRLTVDRCRVVDEAMLEDDLRALAGRLCPHGAGPLDALAPLPSRQGSLFGECLRRGALRAEVHCKDG
ncbi:hypothetical protein [Stenotrophomonas sp.]|uniref:hypothetical protein n=1 Tax=Stenotrophomonas sp. TaxID=69392 RepID=UPI002FC658A8